MIGQSERKIAINTHIILFYNRIDIKDVFRIDN